MIQKGYMDGLLKDYLKKEMGQNILFFFFPEQLKV
jgi:hypothetical protein